MTYSMFTSYQLGPVRLFRLSVLLVRVTLLILLAPAVQWAPLVLENRTLLSHPSNQVGPGGLTLP